MKKYIMVTLLIIQLIFIGSFSYADPNNSSIKQIYKDNIKSVCLIGVSVLVENATISEPTLVWTGTGFVRSCIQIPFTSSYIVTIGTAYHVLDYKPFEEELQKEQIPIDSFIFSFIFKNGSLLEIDSNSCMLTCNKKEEYIECTFMISEYIKPVKLGDSSKLEVGDSLIGITCPLRLEFCATSGIVSKIDLINSEGTSYIVADTHFSPGSSGGPVFNDNGECVLFVNAGLQSEMGWDPIFLHSIPTVEQLYLY